MIYSQVTGGLGNQMFNYAIGYALSQKYQDNLTLDISPYKFSPRPFVLDQFTISGKVVSMNPPLHNSKLFRMIARLFRIMRSNKYGRCKWIKEQDFSRNAYYPYDFSHKASLYLEGYWQHYRYFDEYRDSLCQEFQLKKEHISETCANLIAECASTDSVAVHIRRGDYEAGWLLQDTYYHEAFEEINKKIDAPHYYIFCEDIDYVKKNYGYLSNMTFVTDSYHLSDLEEFHLMSHCKHQITANSSFSWWAAYLNTNPNKIVFAPEYLHWAKDYYPSDWITIKVPANP